MERENPKLGAYLVLWERGGASVATIYMSRNGELMIAPANWLGPGQYNPDTIRELIPLMAASDAAILRRSPRQKV
jgi:hypothetical protein